MNDWNAYYMAMAQAARLKSKDTTQVGALLVRPNRTIAATGYNGFPQQIGDHSERLRNRELKYRYMIHAEQNCLHFCAENATGYSMYVTMSPCHECAKSIIQRGVAHVYCPPLDNERWVESCQWARDMLREAGVNYTETTH